MSPAEKTVAWIWWRRPEEWADLLMDWIEETAQKNTVLTVYELVHGDATIGQGIYPLSSFLVIWAKGLTNVSRVP